VGGYTIVDIGATYDTQISGYDTTFRLAVNNVADKKYWMYQYADYIKAGDARSVSLNATMHF
jgi:iron complex outermembrane receptor protein